MKEPRPEKVFVCLWPTQEEAIAIRALPDKHGAKVYAKRVLSKTCADR